MRANHQAETLLIEGPDAVAFAQSQFSSDVSGLSAGHWQFSAWLDAQGRVRALFHLARLDEHRLLLMLRGGRADALAEGLRRFVFRSKLRLEAMPARALGTSGAMDMHEVKETDFGVILGCGSHALSIGAQEDDDWRAEHIRMGWPWLPGEALDALLPPALSLERLQGIAFDKGCYPGQEIAARLHYRGGHKRHMHRVVLSQCVPAGAVLRDEQSDAVLILDCMRANERNTALAVVHDAVLESDEKPALSWNGERVEVESQHRWPD